MARVLLEHGTDIEAKDGKGRTAMDVATGSDIKDFLKDYLEKCAKK